MNYEKLANKHKIKPSIIKDEYEKYWKQVKKELSSPTMLKVGIPYFGSFVVQEGRLKRKIISLQKSLSFYEGRELGIRDEKFKTEYLKQLEIACRLLKKFSTEPIEGCEICLK